MKRRFIVAWGACFGVCAFAVCGIAWALYAALAPEARSAALDLLVSTGDLPFLLALMVFGACGFIAKGLVELWARPALRLAEGARLIATANPSHRVAAEGSSELQAIAAAINALASRNEDAQREVEARIAAARAELDSEKNRLAALMSELAQCVVVCNASGRILLYNERARQLFERMARDSAVGYLGLGRSIFSLLDRELITHALQQLRDRAARDEVDPVAAFVVATSDQGLLRVRMAPVAGTAAADDAISGFVLLLEDVGDEITRAEQRDRTMHGLIEGTRASSANVRAAIETLLHFPDMAAERRSQFIEVIRDEANRITGVLDQASRDYSALVRSQRSLEEMRAIDLLGLICKRIESRVGINAKLSESDALIWVAVDSYSMAQAICYFAMRLRDEFSVRAVELLVSSAGRHAQFDLIWDGPRLATATLMSWEAEALEAGGETSPLTLREVLDRHAADAWYEPGRTAGRSRYRVLLPLAAAEVRCAPVTARDSRPEFYDFNLFDQPGQSHALAERALSKLSYTVFDTETTGLDPTAGDEIISIGAVRILNGRLLAGEVYEQLVDPQRLMTAAAVAIHGISAEMLAGQPTIGRVLPAFHRFCEDTVLVGHNVAFDMRFLQLKERATGVRFVHPVLDTLLLSAVLHGNLESHRLEEIAARFGVEVIGRHTALGDAIVTGEIFLKMVPLLAERGIVTLRDALAASQQTYYARVKY